jgi:membrane protease YdiL (CAAX protease family)
LPLRNWLGLGDLLGNRLASEAIWWSIAGLLLAWVIFVEGRSLASIGMRRPSWSTFGWAIPWIVIAMATVMLSFAVILPALGLEMNRAATSSIISLPILAQLALFIRAGVVEEILFRGYPIERLEELTGSKWVAALVPAVIFIGGHYAFWGAGQLIVVAMGTIVLTLLYMWKRDLLCCMIVHASTDIIGFTLARLQS